METTMSFQCPSTEDWVQMWYAYNTEYSSAIRKGEILPFVTTWMDIENITLSKTRKLKNHMISLMWDIKLKATNVQIRKAHTQDTHNSMEANRAKGGSKG